MSSQPAPQFELFAFWRTSATYRVRVALNLKGITAHERIVNLDAGEQRSEAFLKVNPLAAIPALLGGLSGLGGGPGCAGITQWQGATGDDDDAVSRTLNWTDGSVHCSHAGLTEIPPLPSNALYL